jgi:D-alanyl-D-alanine carboxypeptidase
VRPRRLTLASLACTTLLACTAVTACATGGPQPDPPDASPQPDRSLEPEPDPPPPVPWRVGARPLPLRADGFGQVRPTPAALRTRRLPTVDRLPPPPGGRFRSTVALIGPAVRARMGATWRPGCPVGLADLRHVTVSFRGFDGRPHTGELVVHERVAAAVVSVFARLWRARFPIEEMRLVTGADLRAHPTGDGNNTAAFVCRAARKQTRWSAHAYGLAVDVNPFQNPYRRGDLVLPELAGAYLDRAHRRPGMVHPGDAVTAAFAGVGWSWGGRWESPRDFMHFSATGG